MPDSRLPNTDLSRIAALQKAVSLEGVKENGQLILSYQTIHDTQQLLTKFRNLQRQYQMYHDQFLKANQNYKTEQQKARMYVSHFIQVLDMAILRGELRADIKTGYGLDPQKVKVPDLRSERDLAEWGEKIIRGEEQRIQHGGVPIYNPNIAKVKVHYSIFAEHYYSISTLRQNSAKYLEELTQMRPLVDDLILDIWNQIEAFYQHLPELNRVEKCRQYGLVYYIRSSELKKLRAEQMQNELVFQP